MRSQCILMGTVNPQPTVATKQASNQLGPQRIDGMSVFTRLIMGALGGIVGFMLIVLAFLIIGSLTQNFFSDDAIRPGVANFAILASLFLVATVTNLIATYLLTLTNQAKYEHIGEGLMQVITVNVILFIFVISAYFLAISGQHNEWAYGIIAYHLVFTALASVLVFEVTATRWAYPLITIYDGLISTFIGTIFLLVLYKAVNDPGKFLFGIPVIIWTTIGFVSGITEYVYYQAYRRIGVDFLQSKQIAQEVIMEDTFDESDDTPDSAGRKDDNF